MLDGSDAIADWPILNALINAVGGATWVSLHDGGGVGIGYSIHAGQVIVADGGVTMMFPRTREGIRRRVFVATLAGPAVNFALLAAAVLLVNVLMWATPV